MQNDVEQAGELAHLPRCFIYDLRRLSVKLCIYCKLFAEQFYLELRSRLIEVINWGSLNPFLMHDVICSMTCIL